MFTQATLFLGILFVIGIFARNNALMIAVAVLFALRVLNLGDVVFPYLRKNGIQIGVIIITISVLIPIATGEIGLRQLTEATRSLSAWVAIFAGVLVAILAKDGIKFLGADPTMTSALVIGTILSVAVFRGVAVGPVIGAGIAYWLIQLLGIFK